MRLIDADKLPIDIAHEDVDDIPVEEVIELLKKGGILVDVVRCKECKYYEAYTEFGVKKGYGFCVAQGMNPRVDDWFCADGEVATVKDEDSKTSGDVIEDGKEVDRSIN